MELGALALLFNGCDSGSNALPIKDETAIIT